MGSVEYHLVLALALYAAIQCTAILAYDFMKRRRASRPLATTPHTLSKPIVVTQVHDPPAYNEVV